MDIGSFAAGAQEEGAAGKRVAVLFPGLVDDQSWNQAGFEGLTRLEEEGAEIAYTERVNQSQQVEVFRNYAQQGYDIIVGHGGEYMDAALQVATEYPDLQFVVTNGNKGADNVTSFTLSYRDMGLLAGALAGLMTESNKLAIVAGQEIPVALGAVEGFQEGVARVNPEAEVNVTYTGSWEDVDKAREAALALISDGADVVWHVLDAADAGVLSAAEDEGVMAIGLYGDQSAAGAQRPHWGDHRRRLGARLRRRKPGARRPGPRRRDRGRRCLDWALFGRGAAGGPGPNRGDRRRSEERTGGDAGVISPGRRSREADDGFRECRAPREVCGARQRSLSPRARDRGRGREWYRLG